MMWASYYDLHSHSTQSDGEHAIEHVASMMSSQGVTTWALTDHDTISGWSEAYSAAQKFGIRLIPGIEITCAVGLPANDNELQRLERLRASSSWHLLAYFPPDVFEKPHVIHSLEQWLMPLKQGRLPRMESMIKRLSEMGMEIDINDVRSKASDSIGRPHLAQAMVDAGYVQTTREAFDTFIGDGGPAFVARDEPPLEQTIAFIHELGGITSLAHPLYYGVPVTELIQFLKDVKCDAVEAFHRSHDDEYRFRLWEAAKRNNLKVTVGSDFHGTSYGQMPGNMAVIIDDLPELILQSKR